MLHISEIEIPENDPYNIQRTAKEVEDLDKTPRKNTFVDTETFLLSIRSYRRSAVVKPLAIQKDLSSNVEPYKVQSSNNLNVPTLSKLKKFRKNTFVEIIRFLLSKRSDRRTANKPNAVAPTMIFPK